MGLINVQPYIFIDDSIVDINKEPGYTFLIINDTLRFLSSNEPVTDYYRIKDGIKPEEYLNNN